MRTYLKLKNYLNNFNNLFNKAGSKVEDCFMKMEEGDSDTIVIKCDQEEKRILKFISNKQNIKFVLDGCEIELHDLVSLTQKSFMLNSFLLHLFFLMIF